MNNDDYEIVWSDDGSHKKKKEKVYADIIENEIELHIRLEKKGRGGKSVTVIYNYPKHPKYFKNLLKKLKRHCGVGGTLKPESLEIQGEQKEKCKQFLEELGFKVKFTGA